MKSLTSIYWLPRLLLATATIILSGSTPVSAYYCDHDLCSSSEQYCCGVNICCDYQSSWWSWYFWVSLLFFIGIFSILWGCLRLLCFEKYQEQRQVIDKLVKKITDRKSQPKDHRRWFEDPESSLLDQNLPSKAADGRDPNKDLDDE